MLAILPSAGLSKPLLGIILLARLGVRLKLSARPIFTLAILANLKETKHYTEYPSPFSLWGKE